jgi:preprotein translocase subunit SecG
VLSIVLGNLTAGQIKQTDEWENLEAAPAVETVVPVEEDVPVTSNKESNSDVPN